MKSTKLALAGLAILLSACTGGDNPDGLFGGNGGVIDPSGGIEGSGLPTDPTSVAYFNQVIGDRVFFEVDQSTLTSQATLILDQQAKWLLANSTGQITVEGHADEQGTRSYNFELSGRRASAVRNYLVSRGIPDSRLSIAPFGKERPVAICSNESCWSQNRRSVTVVASGLGV